MTNKVNASPELLKLNKKLYYLETRLHPEKYADRLQRQRDRYLELKKTGQTYYQSVIKKDPETYERYKDKMRSISKTHQHKKSKNIVLFRELILNMLDDNEVKTKIRDIIFKKIQ